MYASKYRFFFGVDFVLCVRLFVRAPYACIIHAPILLIGCALSIQSTLLNPLVFKQWLSNTETILFFFSKSLSSFQKIKSLDKR